MTMERCWPWRVCTRRVVWSWSTWAAWLSSRTSLATSNTCTESTVWAGARGEDTWGWATTEEQLTSTGFITTKITENQDSGCYKPVKPSQSQSYIIQMIAINFFERLKKIKFHKILTFNEIFQDFSYKENIVKISFYFSYYVSYQLKELHLISTSFNTCSTSCRHWDTETNWHITSCSENKEEI